MEDTSIVARAMKLLYGFQKLEEFQNEMNDEEVSHVFYITDGFLFKYIEKVESSEVSMNSIYNNVIEEIEVKLSFYEEKLIEMNNKFLF